MSNGLLLVGAVLVLLAAVFFFAKILTEAVMTLLILGIVLVVAGILVRGRVV